MKTIICFWLLCGALGALPVRAQVGGGFDLTWNTLAGGGGTSTGGVYAVSGTIGQHDASPHLLTGGNFSLAGGFRGAIQTTPPVPTVIEVWVVNGEVHLRFNGIPGQVYEIERAQFVTGPWRPNGQPLTVVTMPSGGVVEFVDTTAFLSSQSFYRTSTR